MADFTTWVRAGEPHLGLEDGAFLAAYQGNRATANGVALEASPVVAPLRRLLAKPGVFDRSLTASDLLELLNGEREASGGDPKNLPNGWPKTPAQLSQHLKRLAPNLRAAGIAEVTSNKEGRAADQRTKWTVGGIEGQ